MGLLDKLRHRKLLLSFEVGLGEKNEVSAKILLGHPLEDDLEWVRFWTFATARILYEIWFSNTPQAFLALQRLAMILERPLDPSTECLRRAEFFQFRYVSEVASPVDLLVGEYWGQGEGGRSVRLTSKLPLEGNVPRPVLMVSSVALLQQVMDRVKGHARGLQVLSSAGQTLVSQFASEQWEGEASAEKLPQAAFQQALV